MNRSGWVLVVVMALIVAGVSDARAQARGRTERDNQDGRLVIVLDTDLFGSQRRRSRGPSFCRSGAGHPVHGRRWCTRKGFGLERDVLFDTRRRGRTRRGDIVIGRDDEIVIRTGRRVPLPPLRDRVPRLKPGVDVRQLTIGQLPAVDQHLGYRAIQLLAIGSRPGQQDVARIRGPVRRAFRHTVDE